MRHKGKYGQQEYFDKLNIGKYPMLKLNRKILYLLSLIFLLFSLISCSRERTFKIRITNETIYSLDTVSVGNATIIAVGPNQTSNSFEFSYTPNAAGLFSEPFLGITIKAYSDSTTTYINANGYGGVMSISKFREGRINYINIKPSLHSPSHPDPTTIFSLSVN